MSASPQQRTNSSKIGGGQGGGGGVQIQAFNITQKNLRTDFLRVSLTIWNDDWSH